MNPGIHELPSHSEAASLRAEMPSDVPERGRRLYAELLGQCRLQVAEGEAELAGLREQQQTLQAQAGAVREAIAQLQKQLKEDLTIWLTLEEFEAWAQQYKRSLTEQARAVEGIQSSRAYRLAFVMIRAARFLARFGRRRR